MIWVRSKFHSKLSNISNFAIGKWQKKMCKFWEHVPNCLKPPPTSYFGHVPKFCNFFLSFSHSKIRNITHYYSKYTYYWPFFYGFWPFHAKNTNSDNKVILLSLNKLIIKSLMKGLVWKKMNLPKKRWWTCPKRKTIFLKN